MVCRDRSPRRTAGGRKRDPELYHSTGVGLRMDSNRFCTASFLGLDCDAHEESTEYGERRATPSESLQPSPAITSHHQPTEQTGAIANLLQPAPPPKHPSAQILFDIQDSRSHNLPTRRKEPCFCLHTIDTLEHSRGLFLAPQTHPAGFGAEPPIQTTSTTATVSNTTGLPQLCNSTNRESQHCWSAFDISTLSLSIYLRTVRIQVDLMPSSR
jgi:hypothetical protein